MSNKLKDDPAWQAAHREFHEALAASKAECKVLTANPTVENMRIAFAACRWMLDAGQKMMELGDAWRDAHHKSSLATQPEVQA